MKREVLQRGRSEELIWEIPREAVLASLQNSQHRASAEFWWDAATEMVVRDVEHGEGGRAGAEERWQQPCETISAGIEYS